MADVAFYEKPGCINNTRQKQLLTQSGHHIHAHNLLTQAWQPETLRPFFTDRPVTEWFNRAAPRIKSGEVKPECLTEAEALAMMCADPLLIRRPLLEVAGRRSAGFDEAAIEAWIGLTPAEPIGETCPRGDAPPCSHPEG